MLSVGQSLVVPDFLPYMSQNITVVLSINSLTLRDEFEVHNAANVKENPQMLSVALLTWCTFSVLETGGLSTVKTAVWSVGLTENPQHEVIANLVLLMEILAHSGAMPPLLRSIESAKALLPVVKKTNKQKKPV